MYFINQRHKYRKYVRIYKILWHKTSFGFSLDLYAMVGAFPIRTLSSDKYIAHPIIFRANKTMTTTK